MLAYFKILKRVLVRYSTKKDHNCGKIATKRKRKYWKYRYFDGNKKEGFHGSFKVDFNGKVCTF